MGECFWLNFKWVILLKLLKKTSDYFVIAIGCVFYAIAFSCFIEPSEIAPGGVTGIALIINKFYHWIPVGIMIILFNIPLFVLGLNKFKLRFIIRTIVATILSSTLIDIFTVHLPIYKGDIILAALAGGVSLGLGLALIMLKGASTGGAEIIAMLLNNKYRFLSIGRLLLLVDAVVVTLSAVLFRNIDIILYSSLCLFVSSTVIDKLLYGADKGKIFFIITTKPKILMDGIMNTVGRGVTRIKVFGGYTDSEKSMLLCAVRPMEVTKLMGIIKNYDHDAFVTVSDAGLILGEGFGRIEK